MGAHEIIYNSAISMKWMVLLLIEQGELWIRDYAMVQATKIFKESKYDLNRKDFSSPRLDKVSQT